MQVMPDLFKRFASQWPDNPDIAEYQRPEYNIRAGVEYLAWLLDRYEGSLPKALAGYNAGEHRVDAWIREYPWPDEIWIEHIPFQQTRMFVKKILENYGCYRVIYPMLDRNVTDDPANNLNGRENVTEMKSYLGMILASILLWGCGSETQSDKVSESAGKSGESKADSRKPPTRPADRVRSDDGSGNILADRASGTRRANPVSRTADPERRKDAPFQDPDLGWPGNRSGENEREVCIA